MGKRKLAGSLRRYVASGLSRVSGAFRSRSRSRSCGTSHSHSQSGRSSVEDKEPGPDVGVVPVTKIPALDTVDAYAVQDRDKDNDRPIDGDGDGDGRATSERISLVCDSAGDRSVIDGLIRGYARFIAALTGQDDVAFCSTRREPYVSERTISIILASVAQGDVDYREVYAKYDDDDVQFYIELGRAGPENGRQSRQNTFTLFVEPNQKGTVLDFSVAYPRRLIPDAAVDLLLRTLLLYVSPKAPSEWQPEMSIMNFPPSMIPPVARNNDNDSPATNPHLLHTAFEDWARKKPLSIALDFVHSLPSDTSEAEHSILTYAALDAAATNLAVHIRSVLLDSVSRIIPVHMPTSPELYISYLAILKAGHAFCPMPQDAPVHRIQEILSDIDSPIILGNTPEPSTETTSTWVDVTSVSKWKELQGESQSHTGTSLEPIPISHNQTAYLLFTSGSTGKPKGVQVTHLAASCSISSHATSIPLPGKNPGDFRWFQFASPSFDPSLMEIFVTLSTGGTLCSADRRLTLSDLEATINESRATVMMATPSLASLLRPERLSSLEALWSMGEKLNRTVIDNFTPDHRGVGDGSGIARTLVNAYGPTEGAINCTYVAPFERSMRGSIIGKPLPTCAMFILSTDSDVPTPVPIGTVGELAIGGPQVSKGYLNRPDETAKAFVHSEEFGRLYRTGDKARIVWDKDGQQVIEYLGRISTDQVKINGRRVELGEIEAVVATTPGVREVVAVVKRDGGSRGEQIVACLVVDDARKGDGERDVLEEVKANAARRLASFMCPSTYEFLDALPRSSSGKVDRKALVALFQKGDFPHVNGYSEDGCGDWDDSGEEELQRLVVRLVAETAGVDVSAIKPSTELYSVGIDSLGAMRFLQGLKDNGVDGLSVGDVLQSHTCQGLVSLIQRHQTNASQPNGIHLDGGPTDSLQVKLEAFDKRTRMRCAENLEIDSGTIQQALPTTATQSGMLTSFLRSSADKLYEKPTYIYHTILPLERGVNLEKLRKAWEHVIWNYDSFRTVFCMVDDEMAPFAQCILTPECISTREWDVYSAPNERTSEQDIIDHAIRNAERAISLSKPPWKLALVESPTRPVVILSMFHGIFDGGSLHLLLEDVASAYSGNPLPPRTSLIHVVKHHFQADHASTSRYWSDSLQGYSPVPFPSLTPHRTPAQKSTGCVEVTSNLSHEDLKRLSKAIGATPLSVLQAAWGAVLLSYTGTPEQDVVLGSVVSGRLDQASQQCIGPTFTITPSRISVKKLKESGAVTNQSIARYLASSNAKALSYLQPQLGSVTANGQTPYDTVLAYQDFGSDAGSSRPWSSIHHPAMANDFSVMIEVVPELDSSLTLRANFNTNLDSSSTEIMLRQMDDIVRYIHDYPNAAFENAPLQTRADLKSTANPEPLAAPEVSEGALLQSQFEEHAISHPDDPALIFKQDLDNEHHQGNITWTYGELNAMADSLAKHLLETCGDLNDASVPICIDKSPALYVAILGIIKAGGAWCPIDTLSPAQRRHDLIARTSAGILLLSSLDTPQLDNAIPTGMKIIDVAKFTDSILPHNPQTTKHCATPSNTAYLIWTSGTTGAPKGVPITHSAAVSAMRSLQTEIPGNEDGSPIRCLQFSQPTFDVSIQDLFYTWGLGGVLISGTREIMLESFAQLANTTNATHAHLTPAFAAGIPRSTCKTLNVVTMIGEKLTQAVADDWGSDMRAFNTYGPAEATVVSTIRAFGNEHATIKSANIGWPMRSVSVFVIDPKTKGVVMKNAIGELALGGPQLSVGYLGQKDVTDAKYVFNHEARQRLYYTGDLVRMLSDGSLEYITRVDDLVKLGGIRIELSEISFALRGCHGLVEGVETMILSRGDRPVEVVVAFLSAPMAAGDGEAGAGGLLVGNDVVRDIARAASLQARNVLPDNMIPSVYLVVRKIPKTPSAKVDRRALQAAYAEVDIEWWEGEINSEETEEDEADAATTTKIIETVAALVKVESSTITKSNRLRSLGVDSLRATRLAFRLKEAGYKLSVMDVLACVTLQDLIKLARSSSAAAQSTSPADEKFDVHSFNEEWHAAVAAAAKIPEKDEFTTLRATAIQESLLTETMGMYDMYWSNHFFKLDGPVDISRLRQAWFAVCQKTEALRTGFVPVAQTEMATKEKDGIGFSILQVVYKLPDVDWESYTCTEEESKSVLGDRLQGTMEKHQKNYFRHPPWAVTILDKGTERVMVLTLHHSIHDEPSLRFIADDVRAAYTYKPPLRTQLTSALAHILPTETKYTKAVAFWSSELRPYADLDVPVWPDLTGKRVPPGVIPEYKLISEAIPLTESVTTLQKAAADLGVGSIASIVRAAWAFVSLSYLGLPGTVFAETLSDRVFDPSLESAVGPFISVVPVPFHPKKDMTVRRILAEQHRLSLQSWAHRSIHARDIRKALNRQRGEPLYPAVFNFHAPDEPKKNAQLPDLWNELEDQIGLHVEHPMAFNAFQTADGNMTLEASSDSRIFSREHLRLFVRQIDALISEMLVSPDETFGNLVSRLPSNMRSLSNRKVSHEVGNSIYQAPTYWLEKFAESNPDWTAVEVASSISTDGIQKETMSYGTLNSAANRVAAYLASFGYKNRIIGVCAGRTLASYPIIVGIFKSGNTYLPIDESLPADRKAFLVEDAECPIVFTETSLNSTFSGAPDTCRVECIDDAALQQSIAAMPSANQDYASHPDDTSYLLFTSGSTGKPKGVMVTRANLSSFIESISEFACKCAPDTLTLAGTGRYLAQANRAFDPHLLEMFFPWRHGMATVTAPRPMILDDIGTTLSQWEITHASFVPSLVDQSGITPAQCPGLRFMTVGGEKITQKVLDTWASAANVAIVNAYGPTEVTIGCTFAHIGPSTNLRNIGPPLTACTAHVLLPGTMEYALRGQTGELCFSGDLVARGYLHRPDATAASFITGPDGVKMYRTGDIGRLMADDSVEYLGRGDDQTKIRGQRLELGEVSEVLRASAPAGMSVDVVTTVAKHPGLSKVQLISFVSRARKRTVTEQVDFLFSDIATLGRELRDGCGRKLPAYMVPDLVLPVTSIPVAAMSGKADMKRLQALFSELPLQVVLQGNSASTANGAVERALNADEEAVVSEICHVISANPGAFNPLTNIFEVGIDSLSAIGLSIRLKGIGYAASVAAVMGNPVVEQLARLPRSSESGKPSDDVGLFGRRCKDLEKEYRSAFSNWVEAAAVRPCLPLQEGLVARSLNSSDDRLYVNHITLQLGDSVDSAKFKAAWEAVARENDILRTTFASLEREIAQVVLGEKDHELQWTEERYEGLDEAIQSWKEKQDQVSRSIIANISTAHPIWFHYASCPNGKPLALFISIHHALYDGESFAMMLDDVAARYEGGPVIERGSPSVFLEHACAQDTEKAKEHWTQQLFGCTPTRFRSDESIKETTSVRRTPQAKLSDLETRSATLQTTVPNLMQAIFGLLLADYVGSSDVTYGLVLSGRTLSAPGAESVLLPAITTIPGRLSTNGLNTVQDVVSAIQTSTVRSLDYQHTPLRKIQQWLKSETPLFDCLFSYIRATPPSGHNLWTELDSHMPSEYPLALEVQADNAADAVQLECIFSSDFGSRHDGEEFLEKMDAVLSELLSGSTLPLENFNVAQSGVAGFRPGTRGQATQWDESSWTASESKIREITSAFCGLDRDAMSKGASFFSLGVDSVTAIHFARRLRDEGFNVSSSDIMRFSCVGALAKHVEESSPQEQVNGVNGHASQRGIISIATYGKHVSIGEKDSITAMFECTPLQSGMITQTISSGGKVYVNPHPIRLNEDVDVDKLKDALRQVVQANEILRTSFHLIPDLGEGWVGAVHREPEFEWSELNLPSDANVMSEVMALFKFSEEASFASPPIRSVLVKQPDCRILVLVLHHSLYDGASLPFIFEDLATTYVGQSPTSRPQFSEVVPYILSNQEEACAFWTNKLKDYEPVEIPLLDLSDTPRMLASEHRIHLDLNHITQACKAMSVTIQTVSLLSYAKTYAHLLGTRDVVFGQVLAARTLPHPDADQTLGPLFNTVAQRVTLHPKFTSNRALAQRLQQDGIDAQRYQHAPLRTIQNTLRQEGRLGSKHLFDALFVFQKSAALSEGPLSEQKFWTPFEDEEFVVDAEYKLNIEVDHAHDGVVIRATANGAYFDQGMLDGFLREFGDVFCDIVAHPTRCATTIPQGLGELPLKRASESGEAVFETPIVDATPAHEETIRSILAEVTGIPTDEIKPSTSIFNLGLDSLSAIRIASLCRASGIKINVGDILQGNTLRGISARVKAEPQAITNGNDSTHDPSLSLMKDYPRVEQTVLTQLNLQREDVETILPVLPGQHHHLVSWLKSDRKLFEAPWAFVAREGSHLDAERLQNAWVRLQKRHSVLRTVFAAVSKSEALQIILKDPTESSDTFKVVKSEDPISEFAKTQAREEALHPSSLFSPPVRLRLLKGADRDGILLIIHHALYDAWSMPLLVSDLVKLYDGHDDLETNPSFPAFVASSLASLAQNEKEYWTSSLKSAKPTFLTSSLSVSDSDSPPSTNKEHLFVAAWEKIPNLSSLEATARSQGLSLQTLVLLAVARHLAKATGVDSPTMGLYQTGRSAAFNGVERLSGPCLNVTPFVVENALSMPTSETEKDAEKDGPGPGLGLREQATHIQQSLADRVQYEQSSLRDILRWVSVITNPNSNPNARAGSQAGGIPPLFNTWVNLLWMQHGTRTSTSQQKQSTADTELFNPLPIGVPTDFIPSTPIPVSSTAISGLDTSYIGDQNVYIDIGPDAASDSIGFGVRVEGGLLGENQVVEFVDGIAGEIESVVGCLRG
ncbi:nonribosomal siderophore peptide synthase SidC [Aspergillus mulundensis]|uniref:Nonribosomal peptide synthetase sidC n=1 Tax=Aspergillus mulundensis TaxID=1810919 RepID=A0A3D8SU02_9EURO|nr:Peptide synthetase [Aspergillus mulundensis]RDW89800.1 Peptide synthetase [Aspergillus mulundensis]